MRKPLKKRQLVAWLLVLCLLLSSIPVIAAANQTEELQLQEVPAEAGDLAVAPATDLALDTPAADEELRVIILFQEPSVVERGYSTRGLRSNPASACLQR